MSYAASATVASATPEARSQVLRDAKVAANSGARVCWLGWPAAGLPEGLGDAALLVAGGWPPSLAQWPEVSMDMLGVDGMSCLLAAFEGISVAEAAERLGLMASWDSSVEDALLSLTAGQPGQPVLASERRRVLRHIEGSLVIAGAAADCRRREMEMCVWLGAWLGAHASTGIALMIVIDGASEWASPKAKKCVELMAENVAARAPLTIVSADAPGVV